MTAAAPLAAPVRKSARHRTVAAAVAEALRRRILDGSFPAGAQLRQDALAEEFGVSRIPIREALVQIEAEGLVRILPHRGAVVAALSADEIDEVFALRAELEPVLLLRSAPLLTDADYDELRRLRDAYSDDLSAGRIAGWGAHNTRFHLALYQHAGRPRTLALVANLLQECDRHTRLHLSLPGTVARARTDHAALLDLCAAGHAAAAATLLRAHVETAAAALRALLTGKAETLPIV
jgi:DNA-binding GntR family transcriptional regulator